MTEKPNFFKLGIFILIALALIVGGLILFGSGAFGKEKVYFETYFSESVHGLTPGSSVLLSGVKIGLVEDVTFVRRSYDLPLDEAGISKYDQYIHVLCSALEEELPTPQAKDRQQRLPIYVQRGFRLRLASNIITGQAYLEAVFLDPERFPVMEVPWKPKYTYIPSAPSTFRAMQDSVDQILEKLEQIEFKTVVDNLNKVLETLNQTLSQLDQLITGETPEVREIIENIRQLSENLNYLTEHLKDNPSELLFSAPPPKQEK